MPQTISRLKQLDGAKQLKEVTGLVCHQIRRLLETQEVDALARDMSARLFAISTVELASYAISDMACQVRIVWSASGHRTSGGSVCQVGGVAIGIIDHEGQLRFIHVKARAVEAAEHSPKDHSQKNRRPSLRLKVGRPKDR